MAEKKDKTLAEQYMDAHAAFEEAQAGVQVANLALEEARKELGKLTKEIGGEVSRAEPLKVFDCGNKVIVLRYEFDRNVAQPVVSVVDKEK